MKYCMDTAPADRRSHRPSDPGGAAGLVGWRCAAWLVAVAACGGAARPAQAPVGPAVDARTAESDAKGLVGEVYQAIGQAIGRGKPDSLFSLVNESVTIFGPRRSDAMVTRSDALAALGAVVDPKGRVRQRAQPRSGGLEVAVSQGGHSAWAFDVISLDGRQLAVTAILANADDLWSVSAAALGETPTGKQAKLEAARDAIVPPGATATAKPIGPGAGGAVDKLKKGLLDQQSWGDELANHSDAIAAGPTAGEVARGPKAIKRMWTARMKANVREAATGEFTAATTPDGQLAWVSVPVTRVADGEAALPLRIFAIYQKAGGAWTLIVLHEALAVDEPGSGTAFKKIVPPPAVEPAKPEPAKPELARTEPGKANPTGKKPSDAASAKSRKRRKPTPKPAAAE
jgi:ketosteroid isomerase-like protein